MTRVAMFDLDGTLVDSPRAIVEAFAVAFEAMGADPRDPADVRATIGLPLEQAFGKLLGVPQDDPRVAEGVAQYQEAFRTVILPRARSLVFPGVAEGLDELRRRGVVLTVATSKFHTSADALLTAAGLRDHITVLIGADDVTYPKPHPESGLLILERLDARPEHAVMVGDTTHDLRMAEAAGIASVAVTYGVHQLAELEAARPTYVAETFPEVVAHIIGTLPDSGPAGATLVEDMLNDRTHHIEFNGHLTNHVKHAVVALAGLGIAPERIKAYHDNYVTLTPYGCPVEPARAPQQTVDDDNWLQLLGKREDFAAYCEFFDRREQELGMAEMLRRHLPRLLSGWVGALQHATIHLGWALDAGNRRMAIEGIAYLAFAHVDCHPERTVVSEAYGAELPKDSLLRLAHYWEENRQELGAWVQNLVDDTTADIHPELLRSGLQHRIARMLGEGHPRIYETPGWVNDRDTDASWDQLGYLVTLLYLAEPGDFLLLHLMTALHAMRHIADALPAEQRPEAVKCYWTGILGVLFSRGHFARPGKLTALDGLFDTAVDDVTDPRWAREWSWLIARAAEEEEEHNPKLVYVMREMWHRTGGRSVYRVAAGQFTATPELPATFEQPPVD
ncbi:HAD-IA family hydrolase [Streptomyces turgidiscabies]|uniref:Tyrosine-protein kinase PtkA n=2 Tax=Streptomyces TaxID=1883 RepID=L7FE65_STRT8|nr:MULTISPECIES: HAD-IA family hydrolase [Streptomyces]ELP69663.1 HAD hydrolase, family IA, variant 3 [Streptomyces turgidiscabies Car8]MDX3493028.1 HAD-IA family hydrolase [Streptomyces turgidiscabies]